MTKIDSGSTTRKFYFEAIDTTGLELTGLVAGDFTVRRSRDGGALTAYTSPTIAELDATNAAGIYTITVDEDTTVDGGDHQEMLITIDSAANSMVQVRKTLELVRPKITLGATLASADVNTILTSVSGHTNVLDNLQLWIGVDGASLTALPWNGSAWNANVQAQVTAGMTAQGLTAERAGTLPTSGTLATVADVSAVSATTQPRQNKRAAPSYRFKISSMADGTYKATKTCRLRPGAVDVAIELIMEPVFGDDYVEIVGTPTVTGLTDPSVTATELGPRDTSAMIQLAGTAVAGDSGEVEALVTMDNGDAIPVTLDVKVFSD